MRGRCLSTSSAMADDCVQKDVRDCRGIFSGLNRGDAPCDACQNSNFRSTSTFTHIKSCLRRIKNRHVPVVKTIRYRRHGERERIAHAEEFLTPVCPKLATWYKTEVQKWDHCKSNLFSLRHLHLEFPRPNLISHNDLTFLSHAALGRS